MNEEIQKILDEYGLKIVEYIQKTLKDNDKYVTGKTHDSVEHVVEPYTLTVLGASHLAVIDSAEGRGATLNNSGGGFFEDIKEWATLRGIDEAFHYAIYKNINKNGWKSDGLNHLIEQGINDVIDDMLIEMNDKIALKISSEIETIFEP